MNKKSNSEAVKDWRKNTKIRIVNSMGGCCQICKYNKCYAALELHHLDPKEKEIAFNKIISHPASWEKKIVPELRKCILLCANCHREFHNGSTEIPQDYKKFDEAYVDYKSIENNLISCPICKNLMPPTQTSCSRSCNAKLVDNLQGKRFKPKKKINERDFYNLTSSGATTKEILEFFECSKTTLNRFKRTLHLSDSNGT